MAGIGPAEKSSASPARGTSAEKTEGVSEGANSAVIVSRSSAAQPLVKVVPGALAARITTSSICLSLAYSRERMRSIGSRPART